MSRFNPEDDLGSFEGAQSNKAINKRQRKILVYNKFNGNCAYCGNSLSLSKMEIDHVINKSDFFKHVVWGEIPNFLRHLHEDFPDHIDNLFPSCSKCNGEKADLTLEAFRTKLNNKYQHLHQSSSKWRVPIIFCLKTHKTIFYFETLKK